MSQHVGAVTVTTTDGRCARRPAAVAGEGVDPVDTPMIRQWREAMGRPHPAGHGTRAHAPGMGPRTGCPPLVAHRGGGARAGAHDELLTPADEAYPHGMNGIAEAVRQSRGTGVNQVPDAAPVRVTAGTGAPTSGLLLGAAE